MKTFATVTIVLQHALTVFDVPEDESLLNSFQTGSVSNSLQTVSAAGSVSLSRISSIEQLLNPIKCSVNDYIRPITAVYKLRF
jgi:hypothetical protein